MSKDETHIERVFGSLPVNATATIIAAMAGSPLAALLPVLTSSLAHKRQKDRVESLLSELNEIFQRIQARINEATDPQYKVISEMILCAITNTEEARIKYLKRAVYSSLDIPNLTDIYAAQAPRAIRDLSVHELEFLPNYSKHVIMIGPISGEVDEGVLVFDQGTAEVDAITGLLSLGVLIPRGSSIDDTGRYIFAPFVPTMALLIDDA